MSTLKRIVKDIVSALVRMFPRHQTPRLFSRITRLARMIRYFPLRKNI